MVANRVAAFVPSVAALHFNNSFPAGTTYPVITLPVVGTIASQDASTGVCGGFVFTVLDMFTSDPRLQPPNVSTPPADGSTLFNYLIRRLLDSFGPGVTYGNALKAIQWIQTPGHDVVVGLQGPGLAHWMVFDEWPAIKADIDAGRPSPIYLVMAPQCGPGDVPGIIDALGHGHQVLVYGYDLDNAGNLTLQVYDPNDNSNDNSTISLNISVPAHTITISAPGIEAAIADPATIRGLFRAAYNTAGDPTWTGDFTGSGRADVLFYSPGDQNWWLGTFSGTSLGWTPAGNTRGFGNTAGDPTWTGDFTGYGRADVLFYSPGDQNWWLGTFSGTTLSWTLAGNTRGFGNTAGDPTWIGDFTGSGHTEVLFYSPGDQNWWLGTFSGTALGWTFAGNSSGFGNTAGNPTWTGDFTGNGHHDVLFYSPGDTHWFLGQISNGQLSWSLVAKIGV